MSHVEYGPTADPLRFDAVAFDDMLVSRGGHAPDAVGEQAPARTKSATEPLILPDLEIVGAELQSSPDKRTSRPALNFGHVESAQVPDSGALLSKRSSTEAWEKSDGTRIEVRPDGSIWTVTQRGVRTVVMPDGAWIREYPDGTKSTEYSFSHPNSRRIVEFRDGTKVTELRDGSKIIETRDGIRRAWLPDGSESDL